MVQPRESGKPSGIPTLSRSITPTQIQRPSSIPRPATASSMRDGARSPLNSIQATALANATAANASGSRIPMARRATPQESGSATNEKSKGKSSSTTSTVEPSKPIQSTSISTLTENDTENTAPKEPQIVVEPPPLSRVSDDSYEDEEVLAVTGGVAGVKKMRSVAQTLAEFLRTTEPRNHHLGVPRPPSRAQTPVKKRRSLFFRRKKKTPARSASPAPGLIRQVAAAVAASDGNPELVSSIAGAQAVNHAIAPTQRSSAWRLRRKFVALMPGLPGQPQIRTRPPSGLRHRITPNETLDDILSKQSPASDATDQQKLSASSPSMDDAEQLSSEAIAASNAAKNALLSAPSPLLSPSYRSDNGGHGDMGMDEPLSPVGKSLSSFHTEFSAALAAFLQRPEGNINNATSRIAAFHSAYGDIRVQDALKRKRTVRFAAVDELIDEGSTVPSKAAAEEEQEQLESDDSPTSSAPPTTPLRRKPAMPLRQLKPTTVVGTQASLPELCPACEIKLPQTRMLSIDETSNDELDEDDDLDLDEDADLSDEEGVTRKLRSKASMEQLFSKARQSHRSVRHVQVQTSASFFPPPLAIMADALAPVPPPETASVGVQCSPEEIEEKTDVPIAIDGLELDNPLIRSIALGDAHTSGDLMAQNASLREQLEDLQECLRNERRERERLETVMTQARAKFDNVSAQAYKAIRSLMEERSVLIDEARRLRRLASDLVAAAAVAEAANQPYRRPRSAAGRRIYTRPSADRISQQVNGINGADDDDDGYDDCDDAITEDEMNGEATTLVDAQ